MQLQRLDTTRSNSERVCHYWGLVTQPHWRVLGRAAKTLPLPELERHKFKGELIDQSNSLGGRVLLMTFTLPPQPLSRWYSLSLVYGPVQSNFQASRCYDIALWQGSLRAYAFLTEDNTIPISAIAMADDDKAWWSACQDSYLYSAPHFFQNTISESHLCPNKSRILKWSQYFQSFLFCLPLPKVRISTCSPVSGLTAWIDLAAALTSLESILLRYTTSGSHGRVV